MPRPITPSLAADTIIELHDQTNRPIVLIERKYPPYGWAIPGGFVDVGESVEKAAVREAKEETSLDVKLRTLLGIYSAPDRDERGHTASVVYIARASGEPLAQDDAENLDVFDINNLPSEFAFDHDRILRDYIHFRQTGQLPALD